MERSCLIWLKFLKEKESRILKFQSFLKSVDEGMELLEEEQRGLQEHLEKGRRCCSVAYCNHSCGHKEIMQTLEKLEERLRHFGEDKNKLMSTLKIAVEDAESAIKRLNSLKKISELINKENKTNLEDLSSVATDKPKAVNNKPEEKTPAGSTEAHVTRSSGKNRGSQKKTCQEKVRRVSKRRRVGGCGNNKTAKKKMGRK